MTVEELRELLEMRGVDALAEVRIDTGRHAAVTGWGYRQGAGNQPGVLTLLAPGDSGVLKAIAEALYPQGPDTLWNVDMLDDIARIVRCAGLGPQL